MSNMDGQMNKITITTFTKERNQFVGAIAHFKDGCYAVRAHSTMDYWVMSEGFDCKLVIKPAILNKLVEVGFLEKQENRYYMSDNAPKIEFVRS